MAVEIVEVDAAIAVEFWDVEIGVRAEHVLERLVQGVEEGQKLRRQHILEDCQQS